MPSSFIRSIGSLGSFAGVAGAPCVVDGLGDAVGCCAKVVSGETKKMKSSARAALRLNIMTSPLDFGVDFKDEPKFVGICFRQNNWPQINADYTNLQSTRLLGS